MHISTNNSLNYNSFKKVKTFLTENCISQLEDEVRWMFNSQYLQEQKILKDFYNTTHCELKKFLIPQIDNPHLYNENIFQLDFWKKVYDLASEKLQNTNIKLLATHAMLKPASSPLSEVPWHQDAAFWGKQQNLNAISILIPTTTTTPENGCLRYYNNIATKVLPHQSINTTSNTTMLRVNKRIIQSNTSDCTTQIGDVVFHYPNSIHMSYANLSPKNRIIFVAIFRSS